MGHFFRENDINWELLCGLLTDGAPAMLGHSSRLHAYAKKVSPDCIFVHCLSHCKTLAQKTLGPELVKVLKQVIKLFNAVKSSVLNTCFIQHFCEQICRSL